MNHTRTKSMWRFAGLFLLVIGYGMGTNRAWAQTAGVGGGPTAGAPTPIAPAMQPSHDGPPEITKPLLAEVIQAIQADLRYKRLHAFDADAVAKAVPGWQITRAPAIEQLVMWGPGYGMPGGPMGGVIVPMMPMMGQGTPKGPEYLMPGGQKVSCVGSSDDGYLFEVKGQVYRVPRSSLKELDFDFAVRLVKTDPANLPMEKYSAQDKSIFEVIPELCKLGDLDLSMPTAQTEGVVTVALNMRNKSAVQCIGAAVGALGYEVAYELQGNLYDKVPNFAISPESVIRELKSEEIEAKALELIKAEVERVTKYKALHRPTVLVSEKPGRLQKNKVSE